MSTGPGGRGRRRAQGELESQVLTLLHEAPGPVSAAWVRERLDDGLAYTTIVTILTRLLAKQAVTRERGARAYLWRPSSDAAGLAARRMRRVLDGERDRDAVLTRFVSGLTDHDEHLLRRLLQHPVKCPAEHLAEHLAEETVEADSA